MLTELESFDFRQMRANDGRATDEALEQFHQIFHAFFAQFPDKRIIPVNILQTYVAQMSKITAKINQAEYQYFLAKYQAEYSTETPQMRESMAKGNELDSYKKIRSRLQFWAASPTWGNAVRFPEEHLNTVKNLEAWEKLIEPEQSQQTRPSKKIKFN